MIYRDNVDIQRLVRTDLGSGSFSEAFMNISLNEPATCQPVSDFEQVKAGRQSSDVSFNCYVSSSTNVEMADRVVFDGDTFDIESLLKYPGAYTKLVITKRT